MAKIIKSVTLQAGEKFVLPPLAVLKGSTDSNAFTSTCPIPTLETLTCYVAVIAANHVEDDSGFYESENANIDGYRYNGVDTYFTTPYPAGLFGTFDLTALALELKTSIGGIVDTAVGALGDSTRGSINYLLIQTIPSIANNLELIFRGSAPLDVDPATNTYARSRVPFRTRDAVVADDFQSVPACPVIIPAP